MLLKETINICGLRQRQRRIPEIVTIKDRLKLKHLRVKNILTAIASLQLRVTTNDL